MPQSALSAVQANYITARSSRLNVTVATVLKVGSGAVGKVSVLVVGSTVGTINDVATTGAAAAGNLIAPIPMALGVINLEFPFAVGLVIVPGTGQVLSVAYS